MVNSYLSHEDYETFATKYLGVEYEDYVNLQLGLDESLYELDEVEYEIPTVM
jgi:hypothetical protein